MLMFAVSSFCFRVSALVFVPLVHFRNSEYEFRTLSGCAVKMYKIYCFVLVNMHMSDTLGGWDFWDEQYNETSDTTRFVNRGEVTKRTFGKKDAQILEINSKTGLYPLYVTYSCYRTKLDALGDKKLSLEKKQALWNKAVEENVFVICKTPISKAITNRTLTGYSK